MANEPKAPRKPADPELKNIIGHFSVAMGYLDASEPKIRDLIESGLMDVAGVNGTKVTGAKKATDAIMAQIIPLRTKAIKQAFRHLRDNLPSDI